MLDSILIFLTENRPILIGASVTIAELLVIVSNTRKRMKKVKAMADAGCTDGCDCKIKGFLWVINPINLFRKS